MSKELLNEIDKIKKLGKIPDSLLKENIDGVVSKELLEDIKNFFEKAPNEVLELPLVKKLKDFYEKLLSGVQSIIKTISSDSESENLYQNVVDEIINNIEGGYYNPSFQQKGTKNLNGKFMSPDNFVQMGDSGETMFGIDRKHGGEINNSSLGIEFWNIIDKAQRTEGKWVYNFKGGIHEPKLRSLAAEIIYNKYKSNAEKYFTPEVKEIVESDKKLFFQFMYATYNGSAYFRKFAQKLNEEVKNGNDDPKKLYDVVVQARYTIGQSSKKIAKIDNSAQTYT